jgi:hypothetical protein
MITKVRLLKLYTLIRHRLHDWYHHYFNTEVRRQLKNPKSIPIIIISFNQLYYLKKLVDFLLNHGFTQVVILDNASTYPPLLDYFERLPDRVTLHQLNENRGHLSFWKSPEIYSLYCKGYYAVTDADVVPIAECPDDFMTTFIRLLDKAYDRTKVGFSLKLDDIPESNPNKAHIEAWESQYWNTELFPNVYKAPIDTTFALYRPGYRYRLKHFTYAWRTGAPLQVRHGGWYIDVNALTEEQTYYMKTANSSASWQINKQGELINTTHKPIYTHER